MRWLVVLFIILALILVPFLLFEAQFDALAVEMARRQASHWSVGLGLVALLASDVALPIPSSLVSASAGVLFGFVRGTLVVWVGMSLSSLVGYGIGARSSNLARRFVGEAGLARASRLAARFGDLAIIVCRPIPVLAEASIVTAGLINVPFARVMFLSTAANLGVAAGYAAIGAYAMSIDSFLVAFFGALAMAGLAMLVGRLWLRPSDV
jgi:uncharacterized membrane protein YdjX (TVP38/TMEM64 family)